MWDQLIPVMQTLGWLFILCCIGALYLWFRLRMAAAIAPRATTVAAPDLDESYRSHVHEAGHAVAIWLDPYTIKFLGAVVFRDGSGFVAHLRTLPAHFQRGDHAWHYAMSRLAGMAAEVRTYGKTKPKAAERDLLDTKDALANALKCDPACLDVLPWRDPPENGSSSKSLGELFIDGEGRPCPPPFEVVRALDMAYAHAKALLTSHVDHLRDIARFMRDNGGQISAAEMEAIMGPRIMSPHTRT